MFMTPHHLEAEQRFRDLLAAAGLPAPDAVEYEPLSVLFLWHDDRVAVYVDLDGPDSGLPPGPPSGATADGWTQAA